MIEINLLPGARRATRNRSFKFDFKSLYVQTITRVTDKWLLATILIVVFSAIVTPAMWLYDNKRMDQIAQRESTAKNDSLRFARVIGERVRSEAARDSVVRQVRIINAIDGGRFVWPHLMDEVSKALPTYTWLYSLAQTSAVPTLISETEAGLVLPKDGTPVDIQLADSAARAAAIISVRLVGETVDFQAALRLMRQLEQSPYIEGVKLTKEEVINLQPMNKEGYRFTLDFFYSKPDSALVRRVPLNVSAR